MHTGTCTFDVILASEFQKHLSTDARKHGVIDKGKLKKRASKRNWTEKEYHVQNDADVAQKDVIFFVLQTSFHHLHFLVHIQNHMVPEGRVSINICDFIQNWDMEYAQYAVYLVPVLQVHIC